jgi:hypothetical protein
LHRVLKEGVVRGNDQVADPGQHQPPGDAAALHHGDCRLGDFAPATTQAEVGLVLAGIEHFGGWLVDMVGKQVGALAGDAKVAPRRTDIVACGEMLALAAQHDDLDRRIVHRPPESGVERIEHLAVLGVVVLRAIEHHPSGRTLERVGHRLVRLVNRFAQPCVIAHPGSLPRAAPSLPHPVGTRNHMRRSPIIRDLPGLPIFKGN